MRKKKGRKSSVGMADLVGCDCGAMDLPENMGRCECGAHICESCTTLRKRCPACNKKFSN